MDLVKRDYFIQLYMAYHKLLTENQKRYFEAYYYDDLSLKEISDNLEVSRNAVFDQLKKTEIILENYEENLGLVKLKKDLTSFSDELDSLHKEKLLEIIEDVN